MEFANTSRAAAHLVPDTPTDDAILHPEDPVDCSPQMFSDLLYVPQDDAMPQGDLLRTIPDGARRYSDGLYEFGNCWGPSSICVAGDDDRCGVTIVLGCDDEWDALPEFLGDAFYRPELAPWYTLRTPESAEFGGIWVMDVKGLDATPVERSVTELVGSGAAAGPHRDRSRTIVFDALLLACSNAGVEYGLKWLTCVLRETKYTTDNILTYLAAHPGRSGAVPSSLVRQVRQVVLTKAPEVTAAQGGSVRNSQANLYRVTWEMTALSPYVYMPSVQIPVEWDTVALKHINWVHRADCHLPDTCSPMPLLFSQECPPEYVEVIASPPPVCGGCLPLCAILQHTWDVPSRRELPYMCRETAVSYYIRNLGEHPLSLQAFWRICGADVRCEDTSWPLQISGLPPAATLTLDSVTGRFSAFYDNRIHYPVGVVGTPTGSPWRPAIVDRGQCWEFIALTDEQAEFDIAMTFLDREP